MIAGDIEASRALAVRIGEVSAHDGLAPEIVKLCAAVSETIVDPDFPGALVPAVGPNGRRPYLRRGAHCPVVAMLESRAARLCRSHAHLV